MNHRRQINKCDSWLHAKLLANIVLSYIHSVIIHTLNTIIHLILQTRQQAHDSLCLSVCLSLSLSLSLPCLHSHSLFHPQSLSLSLSLMCTDTLTLSLSLPLPYTKLPDTLSLPTLSNFLCISLSHTVLYHTQLLFVFFILWRSLIWSA